MKSVSDDRRDDVVPHKVTLSRIFTPLATIKCDGPALFRSQQARDFACLLDLDSEVARWSAAPPLLRDGDDEYRVDFLALTTDGASFLIDVGQEEPSPPIWLANSIVLASQIEFAESYRLRNAKDLLRYGFYRAPLGDRIRLLAGLEEMGSLSMAECLSAIREGKPMPTLAALILQGFMEIELHDALICPETQVRRLDGIDDREGVIVVAACNHPKMVDSAILRAGRLDRHVVISLPDMGTREAIFRMHLHGCLSEEDHRLFAVATDGLSGAEIEKVVRNARRTARRRRSSVTREDLITHLPLMLDIPTRILRANAVHEIGHAVSQRSQLLQRMRVHFPFGLASRGISIEASAAFLVQDGFGKDRTSGIARAQEEHVIGLIGHGRVPCQVGGLVSFMIAAEAGHRPESCRVARTAGGTLSRSTEAKPMDSKNWAAFVVAR